MRTLFLSFVAALLMLMPGAASAQSNGDEVFAQMTDLLVRDSIVQRLEGLYWQRTAAWLAEKGPLTDDQLAAIRASTAARMPAAYAAIIPPVYAALATVFTPDEAREILATYVPAEKEAFRQTPLGQKMTKDGNAAISAAMSGAEALVDQRAINSRAAAYAFALARGWLPKP